jgi:hypothetical protein
MSQIPPPQPFVDGTPTPTPVPSAPPVKGAYDHMFSHLVNNCSECATLIKMNYKEQMRVEDLHSGSDDVVVDVWITIEFKLVNFHKLLTHTNLEVYYTISYSKLQNCKQSYN